MDEPQKHFIYIKWARDFPGDPVVKSLPTSAGRLSLYPSSGRSPTPRSNWAHEARLLSPPMWSLSSETREASAPRSQSTTTKSSPQLATPRESPRTATRGQCSQKQNEWAMKYTEQARHKGTNTVWLSFHEVPRKGRFVEAESRRVLTRGWVGEEMGAIV